MPSSFGWDVAVASLDKLPSVIDPLIAAVRAGEFDNQITAKK
jgi:hypothetical protein